MKIHHLPNSTKISVLIVLMFIQVAFMPSILQAESSYQFSITGNIAYPQNDFQDYVSNSPVGIGLDFIYSPPSSFFGVGATIEYLNYGIQYHEELLQLHDCDYLVDVRTTNNILTGGILFRVQNKQSSIRPYLDAVIGFNLFYTISKQQDVDYWNDDEIYRKVDHSDITFAYGNGVGLLIKAYDHRDKYDSWIDSDFIMYVDMHLRYMKGNQADYLTKGAMSVYGHQQNLGVSSSNTDMISAQLGLLFEF